MASLSNSPNSLTSLRLEARKTFALGIWIKDHSGKPLDIAGSLLNLTVRKPWFKNDPADPILLTSAVLSPGIGFARFIVQATMLDFDPGEYEYSISLISQEKYSSVLVKGTLELIQNTDFQAISHVYNTGVVNQAFEVTISNNHVIEVTTGPTLAPGTTSFSNIDKSKLDGIEPGAEKNVNPDWNATSGPSEIRNKPITQLVPPGGGFGAYLAKRSAADGDVVWIRPPGTVYPGSGLFPGPDLHIGGAGGSGLDATGIEVGFAPIATGTDSWEWAPVEGGVTSVNSQTGDVTLTADNVDEGVDRLYLTHAERAKIAAPVTWVSVTGKPTLGTASQLSQAQVLSPGEVTAADVISGIFSNARIPKIGELRGITFGTAAPTGGVDGDWYGQYSV